MIDARITGETELLAKLGQLIPDLRNALEQRIGRLCLSLSSKVQDRLPRSKPGQEASARLRSMLSGEGTEQITGRIVAGNGYARAQEFGFKGVVNVKQHLRLQTQAFGKAMKNPRQVMVQTHSMRMNVPEHAFLRSALQDLSPQISAELAASAQQAVKDALP